MSAETEPHADYIKDARAGTFASLFDDFRAAKIYRFADANRFRERFLRSKKGSFEPGPRAVSGVSSPWEAQILPLDYSRMPAGMSEG